MVAYVAQWSNQTQTFYQQVREGPRHNNIAETQNDEKQIICRGFFLSHFNALMYLNV